ncbi:DegV family protein [Metallumcola ferriviriculae]|uniref:DegV family protein n=1 Tax=Metallumcola ferriviriculae TaxID=3039180 RepID=A0AAU0ULZ2_9FIRM|nr:DegV family protein [Desulfitibacteraceae bacterium MK1]
MRKIALVTDSTADIPRQVAAKDNIQVMPLTILFGDKEYLDGVDIQSDEFYDKLQKSKELPRSSQPSPADFTTLYKDLLEHYSEIISIHLSSSLSGTINSAQLAKEKLKAKIHIVDSKSISLGIGLMVAEAAKCIKEGLNVKDTMDKISYVRENSETLFTLNTLEYLSKGGRIGKVSGMLGSMLNIKPIVRVNDEGIYVPFGKARSQNKALKTLEQGFEKLANGRKPVKLAVAHGAASEAAARLKDSLENALGIKASLFTQVGPVIGVHTGPGTIGAAVQYE